MATTYKHIEIPIPFKGMNTDTSPSQIGSAYCASARNVILSEQGHMRVRTGWRRTVGYANTLTSATATQIGVLGAAIYPTPSGTTSTILTHIMDVQGTYAPEYYGGFGATIGSPGTTRVHIVSVDSAGTGTRAAAAADVATNGQLVGNTVRYNNVLYGVSFDPAGNTGIPVCWAGANTATVTTGGVTIANGALTGTFSSAPAASQVGAFLTVTGGATGPLAGYSARYRIISHTAATTTFVLSEPYGLGENTTNVPNAVGATTTINVSPMRSVLTTPPGGSTSTLGVGCVGLFRERLFFGRGSALDANGTDWSGNRFSWSKPGYPMKASSTNVAYLPTNEMIMGMATVPNGLLIFTTNTTFILTGYDEQSFALAQLSDEIGCIHSASICYYKNRAYWAAEDGVYYSDGGAPISLTQSSPGVGVKAEYLNIIARDNGTRTLANLRTVGATVVDDTFMLAAHIHAGSPGPLDAFACDLRTGTWTRWGNSTQAQGYYQPQQFVKTNRAAYAVTPWQIVDVSNCFDPETVMAASYHQTDEDTTSAAAATTSTITASITLADFRIGYNAVKVRGMQFEHNCHYVNATSSPRVAWAVTLDSDANIDASPLAVGNIDARYLGNTVPSFSKYFVTPFRETATLDGAAFRVTLTKTAATNSAKIYKMYLLTDAQPTSIGRVDNPTL